MQQGLGQTYVDYSRVVSSVSVSPFEPKIVEFVGFIVVSLTPLAPTTLPPHILQDPLSSTLCWAGVSAFVSISCWLKPFWWQLD